MSNNKNLDEAIARVYTQMSTIEVGTEQHDKCVATLSKLYALKEKDPNGSVSKDTLVMASANLLGIAMIVGHERAHVVTSKALTFVSKMI